MKAFDHIAVSIPAIQTTAEKLVTEVAIIPSISRDGLVGELYLNRLLSHIAAFKFNDEPAESAEKVAKSLEKIGFCPAMQTVMLKESTAGEGRIWRPLRPLFDV